jgi:hypothetical protein
MDGPDEQLLVQALDLDLELDTVRGAIAAGQLPHRRECSEGATGGAQTVDQGRDRGGQIIDDDADRDGGWKVRTAGHGT